jgi:rod shape-determining protein MreD
MKVSNSRYYFFILMSLLIAFVLDAFYLPPMIDSVRPEWMLLVLCYWILTYPFRVNIGLAWITGLIMDFFTGTLVGSHALAYTLIAFILLKLHHHMRFFTIWQQTLVIFVVVMINQLILIWAHGIQNHLSLSLASVFPIISSTLLWPLLVLLLRSSRKHYKLV